ncbi:unnamed protein product [Ixodes pacificus]
MHCSLRAICLQSFWHARCYEQTITVRTLQSLHHNLIQSIYAPLLHDLKWSLVAPLEGSHCLQLFFCFFLDNALFYCFCLVIKTSREVVFAARSVQSCFMPNNFQGSHHVSPKVDLGFVWTHVMQCKHRFTPGVDGTSATFAAGPNLPSHFPRVRWVTFFLPECCI